MTDLENRKWAVKTGVIWKSPRGAQEQACKDIAEGVIEMPSGSIPQYASDYINALKAKKAGNATS